MIRYFAVSIISAAVSFVALLLIYGVFRIWTEVPSTFAADLIAGIPSYFLNRRWVWKKSGSSHFWGEVVPFWVISILGILLAMYLAYVAHSYAISRNFSHLEQSMFVIVANLSAFGILWVLRFFAFNLIFHPRESFD